MEGFERNMVEVLGRYEAAYVGRQRMVGQGGRQAKVRLRSR